MRQAIVIAGLAMLMSQVAAADVVRHGFIPDAYSGRWVAAAATESHESVIVLAAKAYVSPEANCGVDWVSQTAGGHGSIYAAHLECFHPAEGLGIKTIANVIIWPKNVDQIAVGPDFANLRIFSRCSATCDARRDNHHSADAALGDFATRVIPKSDRIKTSPLTE
jgi:hypothetical protein